MAESTIETNVMTGGPQVKTDLIVGIHTPASKFHLGAADLNEGFCGKTNPLPVAGNTAADGSGSKESLLTLDGRLQADIVNNNNGFGQKDFHTGGTTENQNVVGIVLPTASGSITVGDVGVALPTKIDSSVQLDVNIAAQTSDVNVNSELELHEGNTGGGSSQQAGALILAAGDGGPFVVGSGGTAVSLPVNVTQSIQQKVDIEASIDLPVINGGSTFNVAVSNTPTVDTELKTHNLHTAGTDDQAGVGMLLPGASGARVVGAAGVNLPVDIQASQQLDVNIAASAATVTVAAAPGFTVDIGSALPTGGNTIGNVGVNGTVSVSLVSATATVTVASDPGFTVAIGSALPAGSNTIGNVGINGDVSVVSGATPLNVVLSSNEIQGALAHAAPVSTIKPVLIGLEGRTNDPSPVTNGQALRGIADAIGRAVVVVDALPENELQGAYTASDTNNHIVIPAQAGEVITVTKIQAYNSSTTDTGIEIKSGTATVLTTVPCPSKSGPVTQIRVRGAVGEAINIRLLDPADSVRIGLQGFKGR